MEKFLTSSNNPHKKGRTKKNGKNILIFLFSIFLITTISTFTLNIQSAFADEPAQQSATTEVLFKWANNPIDPGSASSQTGDFLLPIVMLFVTLLTIGGLIFLYSKRKHETGITKSKNKIFMVALISLIVMSLVSIPVFGHADERTSESQVTEVGALEVTQQIIGWANFENNKVEITQQLELKNTASDKIISIDSVTATLEEGYKDIDIKNWIIENDKVTLFEGTGGDSYPTDVIISIGKALTFTITTDMTAQQARDLNGKVPFNISYSFLEEPGSIVYFDLNGGYIESGEETLVDWDLVDGVYQKSYKNGTPIADIVSEWDDVTLKSAIDLDFVKWHQDNIDTTLQRSTTFTAEYQIMYTVTIDLGEGHIDSGADTLEGWITTDNVKYSKEFVSGTLMTDIIGEWNDVDIKWKNSSKKFSGFSDTPETLEKDLTVFADYEETFGGLKFSATELNCAVKYQNYGGNTPDIQYSVDGENWFEWLPNTNLPLENIDDFVFVKGDNPDGFSRGLSNYTQFAMLGKIAASGNINSLLDDGDGSKITTLTSYCYLHMFQSCAGLTQPPELPAQILADCCYNSMFYYCTNLTQAPELPAATLASRCYEYMFTGCTNLVQAPELPAKTLASRCYYNMFQSCSNLTKAPELPAQTLADGCYLCMFYCCSSLVEAPELPAQTLTDNCYDSMFYGCSSLVEAPELPATTLADYCYHSMFTSCKSLTEAPDLPATILAYQCYSYMFSYCAGLAQPPELSATTLADFCCLYMFQNCKELTWAPELPVTTLKTGCYQYMFWGCTSLAQAPELPAKTLTSSCYANMFYGCTSLTQPPELPATALAGSCYEDMFYNCSSLTEAPELPAIVLANRCYAYMFYGCESLARPPELPATTLATNCYQYMFYRCSLLKVNNTGKGTTFFVYPADALANIGPYMFMNTGGPYTSNPVPGETYYYTIDEPTSNNLSSPLITQNPELQLDITPKIDNPPLPEVIEEDKPEVIVKKEEESFI